MIQTKQFLPNQSIGIAYVVSMIAPRYDLFNSNSHGTRCAGVVSMIPQNRKCGVGAAYHARIGGIRCLDGDVSDIVEANSLAFRNDYIDIYSASWGPSDGNKVD